MIMDANQLKVLIDKAKQHIELLRVHKDLQQDLGEIERKVHEFAEAGEQILSDSDILQIGIVGQVKAGKSSFLNALFFDGENILPRASTPMTAGLTILEYGETNSFEVDYFTQEDWKLFEHGHQNYVRACNEAKQEDPEAPEAVLRKMLEQCTSAEDRSAHEMVEGCSAAAKAKIGAKPDHIPFGNKSELQNVLEKYVGASGQYTSVVKSLRVRLSDERLQGLRIVDTPGVNDPVVSRENRTRALLHSCHGVFLLSSSSDFFGSADMNFLETRVGSQGIGKVAVIASKFDSVLQDVGAQADLDGKPKLSLSDAAYEQFEKFKSRMNELLEKGRKADKQLPEDIQLDYTSGISYSISQKAPAAWDEMERQVAQQMKRFYPADFATEEQSKASFEELANMGGIQSEYIDRLFLQNKELLLRQKLESFEGTHKKAINESLTKVNQELERRLKELETTSLEAIKKQKEGQEKLFAGLKDDFRAKVSSFSGNLQGNLRELGTKIFLSQNFQAVRETKDATIRCKGRLWGTNSFNASYEAVNPYATGTKTEGMVSDYIAQWQERWKMKFEELKDSFFDKMMDAITASAQKMGIDAGFDDDFYRKMVERTLENMNIDAHLDLGELQNSYLSDIRRIVNKTFLPRDYSSMKEFEAENGLKSDAASHISDVEKDVSNILNALSKDVRNKAKASIDEATRKLDSMAETFATKLDENAKQYLTELEEKLKHQEKSVTDCKHMMSDFQGLVQLFK